MLGLDLQGGVRVTLAVEPLPGQTITDEQLETARNIIERRVGGIGVSEPQVRSEISNDGQRRIVVEVPGVENEDQVRELVGSTGQLQFIDPRGQDADRGPGRLRPDHRRHRWASSSTAARSIRPAWRLPRRMASWAVTFSLRSEGQQAWCEFTTAHNLTVAQGANAKGPIALDGKIITNPDVTGRHLQRPDRHHGRFAARAAEEERTNLYNTLRFGALPVSLQEQGFDRVEPTLGANFLNQALIAGGIGLVLVLFFMIAYYRLPGVLAALALIFYALVSYAIFRLIGVTLTLAGVAAYILSIGMAVDANILIFERMKEEIRAGKTLVPAIEAGFNRAWSSILDSNVSSILVASWLYWQGTTVVRGFALVLIVGVAVSMFSAVTVTRTMLRYVVRTDWGRRLELYHVER